MSPEPPYFGIQPHDSLSRRPAPAPIGGKVVWGKSAAFRRVLEQVDLVASHDTSVLLQGETGCGKEVVAREIHRRSRRSGRSLVTVNAAGVPATLLESEFFGHEKGAFTDAGQARPGHFEQADGGTLFLDEIGELPVALQPKLLRALQEREVSRLGGATVRKLNVRVIAATNRDLWSEIDAGRFREDLFYRVSVFPIRLPSLRERTEDIPDLLRHFVRTFCERDGLEAMSVDSYALEALCRRPWPGNVRELQNAAELAVIRAQRRRTLYLEDFPSPRKEPRMADTCETAELDDQGLNYHELVANFERKLIETTLARTNGNKSQAAEALRLKRTTLVEKIKRLERETRSGWVALAACCLNLGALPL